MFGISSGELFFIAIIALIVLGPERLPKATRLPGCGCAARGPSGIR